jgi:hypothetical protein
MTRAELLRRYFVWCGERIDEQLAEDLRSIRWLGGGFVEFVVSWLQPMKLPERSHFLRSLLVRRWSGAYGDSVPTELLCWRDEVDWVRFESAARSRLFGRGDQRIVGRPWSAEAREVMGRIRKRGKAAGLAEQKIGGNQWILDRELGSGAILRTYAEYGRRGFSYWDDVRFDAAREAVLRESFSSWFGISLDTTFESFTNKSATEVAQFVWESSLRFSEFVIANAPDARHG